MQPIASAVLFAALLFGLGAGHASAQEESLDPLSKTIWSMFQMRQGKTLCLAEATPLAAVRANVADYLRMTGAAADPSHQAVAMALWTLYPCPFSPYRAELQPATGREIQGVWLFPEASQKFRSWLKAARLPVSAHPAARCDAIAYYPDGELRHAVVPSGADCPFEKAADLEAAHRNAGAYRWSLLRDGRIQVTAAGAGDQVEEWDVFAVRAPFQVDDVQFKAGDLVAYARREKGNEVNAATQFRHLQRLQ